MHVDPIQTCFGFVIDRSRVLKAIYLELLSIERFSLDCRKGLVLVLVLLRPLVG